MKAIKLVASFALIAGLLVGCFPAGDRDDPPGPPNHDALMQGIGGFADKNGTRLKPVSGWRCDDGAQSVGAGFFDTKTGAVCSMAMLPSGNWENGPFYCAPFSDPTPQPGRDTRCYRVISP